MDLGEGHPDQAGPAERTLAVVSDVPIGGEMILGEAGSMPGHDDSVADFHRPQPDRFEQGEEGGRRRGDRVVHAARVKTATRG